jgi:hypothetical protein
MNYPAASNGVSKNVKLPAHRAGLAGRAPGHARANGHPGWIPSFEGMTKSKQASGNQPRVIEKRMGSFTLTSVPFDKLTTPLSPQGRGRLRIRVAIGKKNWWMTDGSSTNSMLKERLFPNPLPFLSGGRRMERREPKTIRRFANLKHDH